MITQCPKTGRICEVTGCDGCWKAEQAEQSQLADASLEPVCWAHWKSPDYAEDPAFLVTVTKKPTGWQTQSANWFPLYTASVRTKDLTDDEIDALVDSACESQMPMDMFARAVIAKFKEKNK